MRNIFILIVSFLLGASCQNNTNTNTTTATPTDSITKPLDTIKVIQDNYTRIQNINSWDKIDSLDIEGMSTEGGYAKYYFLDGKLEKIDAYLYGESGQNRSVYYLQNEKVIFIHIFRTNYNTHMYLSEFDINKSTKMESLYYFYNNRFIKAIIARDEEHNNADLQQSAQDELDIFETLVEYYKKKTSA